MELTRCCPALPAPTISRRVCNRWVRDMAEKVKRQAATRIEKDTAWMIIMLRPT